jgi:hypothetical protein
MDTLLAFCKWLEHTAMGKDIRDSLWLFPVIETLHIFGIVALVGSTSILDLRLMGLTFRDEAVTKLAERFLPWTWFGFAVQLITGLLLFASEASKMYVNWAFRLKMALIFAAGINAVVFHLLAYKSAGKWENDPVAPISARIAGAISILLWFGIVAAGRWIAYVV